MEIEWVSTFATIKKKKINKTKMYLRSFTSRLQLPLLLAGKRAVIMNKTNRRRQTDIDSQDDERPLQLSEWIMFAQRIESGEKELEKSTNLLKGSVQKFHMKKFRLCVGHLSILLKFETSRPLRLTRKKATKTTLFWTKPLWKAVKGSEDIDLRRVSS